MPRLVRRVLPFALIALVAGCSDLTGPQSLRGARLVWESKNLSSYQYVLQQLCFCIVQQEPVVVRVVNDVVVEVRDQSSGAPVSNAFWPTIDELFAEAERARANDRLREIEYHQRLGYPTLIEICCREIDSGVRYNASDLEPVSS